MSENQKIKGTVIYNVVQATILGMSVSLVAWTANKVVALSETVNGLASRVAWMENHGSPTLGSTIADVREIKTMVSNMKEGQARIEAQLSEHMRQKP